MLIKTFNLYQIRNGFLPLSLVELGSLGDNKGLKGIPILGSPVGGSPGKANPGDDRKDPVGEVLIIPIPEEVDGDASRGGESNFALLGDLGPDSFEPSDKIPDSSPKIYFDHGK